MKHAFLVIAHNNWWQLKQLLQMLDAENHDFYLHVDRKSHDFPQEEFEQLPLKARLHIYREYEVFWGGFVQVQVELFLMKKAHEQGYDYYHIISGGDLPLKSNDEIDAFFEANCGKEFVQYDDDKLKNDPEIARRTRLYHYLQNYRRRYKQAWKNGFFTFCERVSLVIQLALGINRVKGLDWTIKYGSNWVSITDALVSAILGEGQEEKIKRVFSYTNCADELFVQTIAYNCGFRDKIYVSPSGKTDNLRYIDWARGGNGNPYTFHREDYELLCAQDALFARKFSETVDHDIIEMICRRQDEQI